MKSISLQFLISIIIFMALALSIPPIPSAEEGHGYDTFPIPSLTIGILLLSIAAVVSIKFLKSPKSIWLFSLPGYVLFSLAIHARIWW